jgi:molybdopterin synthase sulfur carrier subunit
MAIKIRIPTPLRKFTANQEVVEVEGATVGQALANLGEQHPDIRGRLFDDAGKIRRFVNVFANEEDIRFLEQLETALKDGDELALVPAIAGGSW